MMLMMLYFCTLSPMENGSYINLLSVFLYSIIFLSVFLVISSLRLHCLLSLKTLEVSFTLCFPESPEENRLMRSQDDPAIGIFVAFHLGKFRLHCNVNL